MNRFEKPIEGENIRYEDETKKKGLYDVSTGINVHSPWEGVVQDVPSKCNGYLKIKHNVENEIFYSNFCNLEKHKVSFGNNVRKGSKIGETGNEKLSFWITNDKDKKQSIDDFFKGAIVTSSIETKPSEKEKQERDKEKEISKNLQKQEKKQEKKQSEKYKEPKTSGSSERIDKEFDKGSELLGLRLMAAPFTIVGSALKEEIDRIKQLLK